MESKADVAATSSGAECAIAIGDESYPIESLLASLGFLLHASYLQIRESLRSSGDFDVTPAMFELMRVTRENPGIRHSTAAVILLIQGPNMTALVQSLVKAGLIRRGDAEGKRRTGLWLTSKGEIKLFELEKLARDLERFYTSPLDAEEGEALKRLLGRLYLGGVHRKLASEIPTVTD